MGLCCSKDMNSIVPVINVVPKQNKIMVLPINNALLCKKCNQHKINTISMPCLHTTYCTSCVRQSEKCIICNSNIINHMKIFVNN